MKLSLLKLSKPQILLAGVMALLVVTVFAYSVVFAGSSENARGFAWGGTSSPDGAYQGLGWISMNSLSDGSGANYGVNIPASGSLSGYAWSEHYGWLSFNGGDLAGCNPGLGQATRSGNSITGGARITAIRDAGANAGGFDGCISLAGPGYGLTINGSSFPFTLSGYAWSGDLGWIDFSGVTIESIATASISATSCTIALGSSSCGGTLTWNIQDALNPSVYNQTTATQYSTSPTGTNVPITFSYGSNNVVAQDSGFVIQTITVSITCAGVGAWDPALGQCVDPRPNLTQPNISYVPSTGFDPATGAYNYVDVTFQTQNDGRNSTGAAAAYDVQFDRNNDGVYENTNTGSISALAGGAYSAPVTQRFNNVAFGTVRIRVAVDTSDAVAEVNESDNERVLANITLPPPNPGMSITGDNVQLRNGETTTIRWDTLATYPTLVCEVNGPGINQNPSALQGSATTQPITAKSEYVFRCTETTTNTTWTDSVTVETQGVIEEI